MEELIKSIILGIIQGLTEFLPVSSSGHIELGKKILGIDFGEENLLFTVIVHCATVLSTIVVFRKDIIDIIKGIFQFKWNEEWQFSTKILISMLPVMVVGLLWEDKVEAMFNGQVLLVGLMLFVTGGLLFLTKFAASKQINNKSVSFKDAVIIGIAQAVAVLPGISRSGSTISTGLLLGVDKSKIAKFSFLMVLPPILGATLLKTKDLMETPPVSIDYSLMIAGFIAAFFSGLLACTWMINIVKRGKLEYFAYYCFIVGGLAIGYHFLS